MRLYFNYVPPSGGAGERERIAVRPEVARSTAEGEELVRKHSLAGQLIRVSGAGREQSGARRLETWS